MQNYTIEEFIQATGQQEEARRFFELENPYMLEVNLNGMVWAKLGTMKRTTLHRSQRHSGLVRLALAGDPYRHLRQDLLGSG